MLMEVLEVILESVFVGVCLIWLKVFYALYKHMH